MSSIESPMFSQRIVNVDFYTSFPLREFDSTYSDFRRAEVSRVPVLRIFGSTPQGQKTCAHIHGVFPYISVLDDPSIDDFDSRLCTELDKALNDFLGSAIQNRSAKNYQHHVFNITKIRGRTFYGYRSEEEVFHRIYFYNPLVIKKAVDLLMNGKILGKTFQPYETHIPYQLQFMIDFDLYGMNLVHYSKVKFRKSPNSLRKKQPSSQDHLFTFDRSAVSSGGAMTYWELSQLPSKYVSSESLERSTSCELEIDVLGSDIIISLPSSSNARSINPGIDAIWKDEIERRRQNEEENWSQVTIPSSQEREKFEILASEQHYRSILQKKLSKYTSTDTDMEVTSSLENSFPSSQVQTYLPAKASEGDSAISLNDEIEDNYDDEELLNLLYEMQREKELTELKCQNIPALSTGSDPEIDGDRSFEEENVDERQDIHWNQSLLSQTIIDEFMSSGNMESVENDDLPVCDNNYLMSESSQSSVQIFQGDGQAGDDDDFEVLEVSNSLNSNSDDFPSPIRRSGRRRTLTSKLREKVKSEVEKGIRSQELSVSNAGRLSLSFRRKTVGRRKTKSDCGSDTPEVQVDTKEMPSTLDDRNMSAAASSNLNCNLPEPKERENEITLNCLDNTPTSLGQMISASPVAAKVPITEEKGDTNEYNPIHNQKKNSSSTQVENSTSSDSGESRQSERVSLSINPPNFTSIIGKDSRKLDLKKVLASHVVIPVTRISPQFVRSIKEIGLAKAAEEESKAFSESGYQMDTLPRSKSYTTDCIATDDDRFLKQLKHSPEVECNFVHASKSIDQSVTDSIQPEFLPKAPTAAIELEVSEKEVMAKVGATIALKDDVEHAAVMAENSVPIDSPVSDLPRDSSIENSQDIPTSLIHTDSKPSTSRSTPSTPKPLSKRIKGRRRDLKKSKSETDTKSRILSFDSNRISEATEIEENCLSFENADDLYSPRCPSRSKQISQNSQDSFFETKRDATLAKARKRSLKRAAAELEQDGVDHAFNIEYTPLTDPLPYQWVTYNLQMQKEQEQRETERQLPSTRTIQQPGKESKQKFQYNENSSDEEPTEDIRKCFGESSSDEGEGNSSPGKLNESSLPSQTGKSVGGSRKDRPKESSSTQKEESAGHLRRRKFCWEDHSTKKHYRTKENAGVNVSVLKPADRSELDGPSMLNQLGFAHDMSNLQEAKAVSQHQYITLMSVEVLCQVREDLTPDPKCDAIDAIFVYITNDVPDHHRKPKNLYKCLLVHSAVRHGLKDATCEYYANEKDLIDGFIRTFQEWDPDILVGYEVEKMSWGYIVDRGLVHNFEMTQTLSRLLPRKKSGHPFRQESWDGQMPGRIVLNLWRLMRHEITVTSYTFENVAYHVLHRKVFKFSYPMLAEMWSDARCRVRVMEYFKERVVGVTELMDKLDMINRTSELARLFGIQFYEVFSRGSQFRVESMMLRAAKRMNLIPPSPSINQRARMKAPEFLPLILEPLSKYYTNPVAVLDFQSLYPSMIIAYNYDYSTVLGRVEHLVENSVIELGCLETIVPPNLLEELKDHIHISPAGVAFVTPSITRGILPQMLEQILDTRQMVKRAMKKWKNEGPSLQKILDSRQLGLKLIANVTYGYTSANFSGRMPCVEIADSVVSKGRETLQRAIDLVKIHRDRWGANVVYGDTDSMFLEFPGKDRREAFKLAQDIADEVTNSNPKPVKLKLEKIYQPCILQTKKRYVGYSYETPEQEVPVYDAKGIETVRRDGCPAVKKILEKCLHVLFTTNDPEKVKTYVQLQFKKLFTGRVSMKEYTFARAFRGREGYKPGACVPALEIAKRITEKDPRAEPLTKQRVPYVVVYGKPTQPLIQLVRTPNEFVVDYTLRLNAHYYIEKAIIPALNRCLALAKIDVSRWYRDLPRKYLRSILDETKQGQGTLDDFVHHANCFRCDEKTLRGVCLNCDSDSATTASFLLQSAADCSKKLELAREICEACSGYDDKCTNADCPVFHKLLRYERDEYFNRQKLLKLKDIEF